LRNRTLKYNSDGSLTIYLGNQSPGADKESNWFAGTQREFLDLVESLLARRSYS
jgi:hypothetical protein